MTLPLASLFAALLAAPAPEPVFSRREGLREHRNKLVADISRRTGEPYGHIHARMNRATGARSVAAATVEQLEMANDLLVSEISALVN